MAGSKKMLVSFAGILLAFAVFLDTSMVAKAGNLLCEYNGGVSAVLSPSARNASQKVNDAAKEWNIDRTAGFEKEEESRLVMANVKYALNVRLEPDADSSRVGMLYKDCGGEILERQDGWTRLKSGELVGWASDEYLLFGAEAEAMASNVGITIAHIDDTLRVRREPSTSAEIYGYLPKGDQVEVLSVADDGWACVDFNGKDGYVSTDYVSIEFKIDAGETMEEIRARKAAEAEAKRHVNYGAYTTDADTTLLLAALIQCEAGGEPYEGQVAVGAVVMNRVRSAAYPDSIHGVIYASGQFTPAQNGRVNQVLESGNIKQSCIEAAVEAISGVSNVGDMTHFRRNNGSRSGLVIGNHVFY